MATHATRGDWALALLACATLGCQDGSDTGAFRGTLSDTPIPPVLSILSSAPADGSTRVPLDATIALRFDAPVNPACLADPGTWLELKETRARVPITLELRDDGSLLTLRPREALTPATWYTCHVSPLLRDASERLLEEDGGFSFCTIDVEPPVPVRVATDTFVVEFDEPLAPASLRTDAVRIEDAAGRSHPIDVRVIGNRIELQLVRDLYPTSNYVLVVDKGAVTDLDGNRNASGARAAWRTSRDDLPPQVVSTFPGPRISASPRIVPSIGFSETVFLRKGAARPVQLLDDAGHEVPCRIAFDPDGRTLRLHPETALGPGRAYTVRLDTRGRGALLDLAGNALSGGVHFAFTVGSDDEAPTLAGSRPMVGATRVPVHEAPELRFSEPLDPDSVQTDALELIDGHGPVPFELTLSADGLTVSLRPDRDLAPGQAHWIRAHAGPRGVRDRQGNPLRGEIEVSFATTQDATPVAFVTSPSHGNPLVSVKAAFTAVFDAPLDAATVNDATVYATDADGEAIAGTVTLSYSQRVIRFVSADELPDSTWIQVHLRGGAEGLRETTGNTLSQSGLIRFRTGTAPDTIAPKVDVSLNGIASQRRSGLAVPTSGFSLIVTAEDPARYDVDLASFSVRIEGEGDTPTPAQILGRAEVRADGLAYRVAYDHRLTPGDYAVTVEVRDLAGNVGKSETLAFRVADFDSATMPFERTHVVWVRFDLDRDGNHRADFEDDLVRLGLATPGSPTYGRMVAIVRDGVLSQASQVFGRRPDGGRIGPESIPVLFSAVRPLGVPCSEIAFGGLDPSGTPGRSYGDKSTGTLGRAYYDRLNSSRTDRNTATSPALGVFGGELFLFEASTHERLYPHFVTTFGKRFLEVCADMGGTPVGKGSADADLLAASFDKERATDPELNRYAAILQAADDWATVTGVILAHEVGHTVGLVAIGTPPAGLHGDNSLHNAYARAGEVMSPAVSYDALVRLEYRFRDLSGAYLRQQVLLK